MEEIEILNALMSGTKVKVKEDVFKYITRDFDNIANVFTIYQIEQGSVNLYNVLIDECYHDILFEDISLF